MSLQLTSGSGERTCDEAALWLNEEPENLTLLSYSYCIMGTLKPADIWFSNFETYYTRNPSCRVPWRGALAGKKSPHYIPVAETPSEFHPSKKISKVWRIWRKSGRRKKLPIISLWHGFPQNFTLLKINSGVWRFWRCRGSWKKYPPSYISYKDAWKRNTCQKTFKSLANLTEVWPQKKSSHYILVTRPPRNEHLPRKNGKVWRFWRCNEP